MRGLALPLAALTSSGGPAAPWTEDASFALHRIRGDGACMFRAVVQGAQHATTGMA
jgi:hypothetical protein